MKISPARVAAFDILSRIETERAFSSFLLPEYEEGLSQTDRRLCHKLALGVLRSQMYLDRVIDHYSDGKRLDDAVRISLRLGLFQLLFLDKVPAHSAVNESVNLVQRAKKSSARGFVNAVLRRSLREVYRPGYKDEIERLSVETSHPRWLIEKWTGQFGEQETTELAAANNETPHVAFRLTAKAPGNLRFDNTRPSAIVDGCFVADSVSEEMHEAAKRGEIYFQDEGSQLVGSIIDIPENGSFIDVCAAPGSKITQIGVCYDDEKHLFIAGDIHSHRTRFLLHNTRLQGLHNINVVEYNAEQSLPFADESFDSVLVDAPCSGTGTIRHNPEIRYFLRPEDFVDLSGKQLRILQNASKLVMKGGSLVYSTCSLEMEENEQVADAFLQSGVDFRKTSINVPDRLFVNQGYVLTMPHHDQIDGFFIASFVRSEAN